MSSGRLRKSGKEGSGKSGEPRRTGRPRDEKADKAILDAALELFIERGAAGTSIEEVAKRAGVARTTLYRRWPTKNELLADAIAEVRLGAESEAGDWRDLSLPEVLKQAVDVLPGLMSLPYMRPLVTRLLAEPELFQLYREEQIEPRMILFKKLLDKAKRQGHLPPDTDTSALQSLISGLFLNLLLLRVEPPTEAATRAYLLKGFSALNLRDLLKEG